MKCKNKTASCNDETCPFDEMFGLKEDPPSQEWAKNAAFPLFSRLSAKMTFPMAFKNTKQKHK